MKVFLIGLGDRISERVELLYYYYYIYIFIYCFVVFGLCGKRETKQKN